MCGRAAWRVVACYSPRGHVPPTVAPFVCRDPFDRPLHGVVAPMLCFFVPFMSLAKCLNRGKRVLLCRLSSTPRFGRPVLSGVFGRVIAGSSAEMRPLLAWEHSLGFPGATQAVGRVDGVRHAARGSPLLSVLLEAVPLPSAVRGSPAGQCCSRLSACHVAVVHHRLYTYCKIGKSVHSVGKCIR